MPEYEDWREGATCRSVDPDLFFSETPEGVRAAKLICAACPVLDTCLSVALARPERYGVWGGLTPAERTDLLLFPGRWSA